ncbi:unnamed protein product, partial [Polarella glacialis]
ERTSQAKMPGKALRLQGVLFGEDASGKRSGEERCKWFDRGGCKYGDDCRYSHTGILPGPPAPKSAGSRQASVPQPLPAGPLPLPSPSASSTTPADSESEANQSDGNVRETSSWGSQ